MAIALALVLHAHQPAGNFDSVIEQTYQTSYRPFLDVAEPRPWLKLSFHFSGYLLDWLAQTHPDYIARLHRLRATGRIELLSGGYYEPILAAIPAPDQQEQIRRLSAALERLFGPAPRTAPAPVRMAPAGAGAPALGAWLAERVWDPGLPPVLAQAGIDYTLLDDSHFAAAGLAPEDLHGYWWTESQGASVRVVPSNFFLRQALPFRPEAEGIDFLRQQAERHPGSLLTMGDDLEKFGSWPRTAEHVYGQGGGRGWLDRFFDQLEQHSGQIETVQLGDYLARQPARGLIYLPSASYPEMMKWAGNANWQGFFSKYREANLLHKSLWDLYQRQQLASTPVAGLASPPPAPLHGREHRLAAEANDVYWHGWFGGLYSPHLRNLAFTHLIEADRQLRVPGDSIRRWNLHADGSETIELRTPQLRALISPRDGATIEELDFLPAAANCINSMQRRPEKYHDALRASANYNPAHLPPGSETPADASGAAAAADLLRRLAYDRYGRHVGRLYLVPAGSSARALAQDLARLQRDAEPETAGGPYAVVAAAAGHLHLQSADIDKSIEAAKDELRLRLVRRSAVARDGEAVLELVFNLLAPGASDRYWESGGQRRSLDWRGELPSGLVRLYDGWRRFGIECASPQAEGWRIEPLYSISQSEQGFEAVYQGSALLAFFPAGIRAIEMRLKFFQ